MDDSAAMSVPGDADRSPAGARDRAIDSCRFAAIFAVIFIHTLPFRTISWPIFFLINQASGFAVPFFFIASGYLFTKKMDEENEPRLYFHRYVRKLVLVFSAWSLIYLFLPFGYIDPVTGTVGHVSYLETLSGRIHLALSDPMVLLVRGIMPHLWFLPALILALTVMYAFNRKGRSQLFLEIAVPLYVLGVMTGSYSFTRIGINLDLHGGAPLLTPFLFTGLGMLLAREAKKPQLKIALAFLLAGLLIHFTEAYILLKYLNWPFAYRRRPDFLYGTVPFSLGVMLLTMTPKKLPSTRFVRKAVSRLGGWTSRMGEFTLGIYGCHMIFVMYLKSLRWTGVLWQVALPVFAFSCSLTLSVLLRRVPGLSRLAK
jgi:surface polysaccharide O-acyltransferase-like enzyme